MANVVATTLEECVIVYNPRETDSDKISTKLSATATDLTAVGGNSGAKITKVACTSTPEEKQHAKNTSSSYRNVGTMFVITEDMLLEEEPKAYAVSISCFPHPLKENNDSCESGYCSDV
jgi:hypothetical protein